MDWIEQISEYKSHLMFAKKLLSNSILAYISDVEDFHRYLIEKNPEFLNKDIEYSIIEQYFFNLDIQGIESSSQARKISSLRSFFSYLIMYEKINSSPMDKIDSPKLGKKIPDTITMDELILIFKASKKHTTWLGLRNTAIIDVLYSTGLRVSELINLHLSDLFLNDGFIRVLGKGDKERLVPINEQTINTINEYRNSIDGINSDFLFLNNRKKGLTREMIFTIIKKITREAGIIRNISPHTFRHTFATHLITAGVDIRLVQEILGHESIITTEIYTHLDTTYKRQLIDSKHPLGLKKPL